MRIFLISSLLFVSFSGFSQTKSFRDIIDPQNEFREKDYSILIRELGSPEVLFDHNSSELFVPASLVKLVVAISVMGRDLNKETRLVAKTRSGKEKNQYRIFQLSGSGDPTFANPKFRREGDLERIVDSLLAWNAGTDSIFIEDEILTNSPVPGNWKYADMGNYYAAGLWTLNYQGNSFEVSFQQNSNPGNKCGIVSTVPEVLNFELENHVISGEKGSGDNAYIFGAPYATKMFINGTIPPGTGVFTIKGANPNPPAQLAADLRSLIQKRRLSNPVVLGTNTAREWIWLGEEAPYWSRNLTFEGPSDKKLIAQMLQKSDNLIAEFLFGFGSTNSLGEGQEIVDGSGLSRENRLKPKSVVRLLENLTGKERLELLGLLPVAGQTGTLSGRFKDTKLEGKIYAKTGSMSGVRCLAGYIVDEGEPTHAFCYMINTENNAHARELQKRMDKYLESLDLVP